MSIQALANEVQRLDEAYRAGHPLVSDAEFDGIREELVRLAPDHPVLKVPGGGQKLLSIGNQPFDSWYQNIDSSQLLIAQPKIDGVAIALRYEDGFLVRAWTRNGRDVTAYMRQISNVRHVMSERITVEIRGELYGFGLGNSHSQRVAASYLRKKAPDGEGLRFCAFQIFGSVGTELDDLGMLQTWGFETPGCISLSRDIRDQSRILHSQWLDGILFSRWPTDGFVLKVNDKKYQKELGEDSRAPRWALAIKDTWKEAR